MNENVGEEDEQWISAEVEIYTAYRGTTNTKSTEAETDQSCRAVAATTSQHPVSRMVPKPDFLTERFKPPLTFLGFVFY